MHVAVDDKMIGIIQKIVDALRDLRGGVACKRHECVSVPPFLLTVMIEFDADK